MAHNRVIIFIFMNCLLLSLAIDAGVLRETDLQFGESDVITLDDLTKELANDKTPPYVGDLMIGEHRSYETVYRRTIEISNPTKKAYKTGRSVGVNSGIIHYVSILNKSGSYAVACDKPYSLGGSNSEFNLRIMPNSKATLTVVIATH